NQWQRWSEDIIPALVKPYMEYLAVSQSLHVVVNAQVDSASQCHNCVVHRLHVCCLFFHHMFGRDRDYLLCVHSSSYTAHAHGLFACSPVAPTLAVDLCLLEFMKTLFVWLTPNMTAWCKAFECFLDGQGYKLQSKVCVLLSLYYVFILCSIYL
ncbi:hypothetical protein EDC04DRAFT_2584986, partial [Pisolithus marmoratus]